ncbi:hypothetical protein CHLRE_09g386753v5 [Chlamydomonas reinhardtii]|uniref:Uncharacterized protein n=1 Tax=Chlamydomonas reinhardtii TaxID=3055 RepID=A0A2K3DCH3_CHLRE|nr:uncharacterized protein CHLRE_09g386753v5 [Chlamydomonas reinhardtii]PNW78231.1 hypothetical protein CHLRE_09g386753v5 [Chlamydomonas reinhardtii]
MADATGSTQDDGSNTVIVIVGVVLVIVGGALLYSFIQYQRMMANAPARPKKKLGAKQIKREKLKMGVRPPGDD